MNDLALEFSFAISFNLLIASISDNGGKRFELEFDKISLGITDCDILSIVENPNSVSISLICLSWGPIWRDKNSVDMLNCFF